MNRTTVSGRVAARTSATAGRGRQGRHPEAAYSLRLEKEIGSIVPGKLANFTILGPTR